jgi:uncharacterized protein YkwD
MLRSSRTVVLTAALSLVGGLVLIASPASAASAPAKPAVTAVSGDGRAGLAWSAAAANGRSVSGYQVATRRYLPASGTWGSYSFTSWGASTRSRVVAVTNGTTVQLLVRARNALGYSAWNGVTTTAGLPGAVPGTTVSVADQEATVSWSTPRSNGSPITAYRVTHRHWASGAWTGWTTREVSADARTTTLTGLLNGRTYQFQVRATNARGTGAPGVAVKAQPVGAPPSTPPPTTVPPTTVPPTTVPPATTAPASVEVARILSDTNAFRAANGKPPLIAMPALNTIADEWARTMHDQCIFEHRSSFSVYPAGWTRAGENIAAGYSYTSVVQGWIDSPGHRANMLGDFTHIGIGYKQGPNCYRTYFVQNFAKY